MHDGFAVCQRCFSETPGVDSWEGRVYCEACYPIVAPQTPPKPKIWQDVPTFRQPSAMTLRSTGRARRKEELPGGAPIPKPNTVVAGGNAQFRRSRDARPPMPLCVDVASSSWQIFHVTHDARVIQFYGRFLALIRHEGTTELLLSKQVGRLVAWAQVEIYHLDQAMFVIAGREFNEFDDPLQAVAYRVNLGKLRRFLSRQLRSGAMEHRNAWTNVARHVMREST